jgi:Phage P2 GpU
MMLGCLGPLPFIAGQGSLFSPTTISKSRKNSWARHKIMNANDRLEDTGTEPIELSIEMNFFAPWTFDPGSSLTMLEGFAESKTPMPCMLGTSPLGRGLLTLFVVESIEAKMEKWRGSRLTVMNVTVKLIEYALPPSPVGGFLSNPLGSITSAVGGAVSGALGNVAGAIGGKITSVVGGAVSGALGNVAGAVTSTAGRFISSIGLPGPIGGAAVSGLGLGSNPNILAAHTATAGQIAAATAAGRAATGG